MNLKRSLRLLSPVASVLGWINISAILALFAMALISAFNIMWQHLQGGNFVSYEGRMTGETHLYAQARTVDLIGSVSRGRGYSADYERIIFTNYHVVDSLCPEAQCDTISFSAKPARGSSDTYKPRLHTILECYEWLDLCALIENGADLSKSTRFAWAVAKPDEAIFVLPRPEDDASDRQIIAGSVVTSDIGLGKAKLGLRPGYSGSPIFNGEGKLLGMVAAVSPPVLQNLADLIGLPTSMLFSTNAYFVPAGFLNRMLECRRNEKEDCLKVEVEIFLDFIQSTFRENSDLDFAELMNAESVLILFAKGFTNRLAAGPDSEFRILARKARSQSGFGIHPLRDAEAALNDPLLRRLFVVLMIADYEIGRKRDFEAARNRRVIDDLIQKYGDDTLLTALKEHYLPSS